MKIKSYHGSCLDIMPKLIRQGIKVDAIITDPPYGTTACKWDSVIDFDIMWQCLNKLIKDNGAIVLFGSEPFSSALRMSNIKNYKYDWIWQKSKAQHFAQAPYRPMTINELISIFSFGGTAKNAINRMQYLPQGLVDCNIERLGKKAEHSEHRKRKTDQKNYKQTKTNYPQTIIEFNNVGKPVHPTQKPVALMEYLIKTYTNEGDTVLDFTMGSGTTGVACVNLDRKFIGIEKDDKYYHIAAERIQEALKAR